MNQNRFWRRLAASGRIVIAAALLSGMLSVLTGCNPNPDGALKPPKQLTPDQAKQDLDRRIAEIQNDPNIPEETKKRSIGMMRATEGNPASAPEGAGAAPKVSKSTK